MNVLRSFLSGDETEVDSVIVCGAVALLALIIFTTVAFVCDHTTFSAGSFAGSSATLIGSVAAGKTARDRFAPCQGQQKDTPQ